MPTNAKEGAIIKGVAANNLKYNYTILSKSNQFELDCFGFTIENCGPSSVMFGNPENEIIELHPGDQRSYGFIPDCKLVDEKSVIIENSKVLITRAHIKSNCK
ncbi:hypothetical protein AUTU_19340 [Aureibacter tunicatorum]|nr:hypothetical protein AUTU_19340 [Aureibacter tunicatorum]